MHAALRTLPAHVSPCCSTSSCATNSSRVHASVSAVHYSWRGPSLVCLAAKAEKGGPGPGESDKKNEDQLSKILIGLPSLLEKRKQSGEDGEDEDEEYELSGEEGVDWAWYEADPAVLAKYGVTLPAAEVPSSSITTTPPSSSSDSSPPTATPASPSLLTAVSKISGPAPSSKSKSDAGPTKSDAGPTKSDAPVRPSLPKRANKDASASTKSDAGPTKSDAAPRSSQPKGASKDETVKGAGPSSSVQADVQTGFVPPMSVSRKEDGTSPKRTRTRG